MLTGMADNSATVSLNGSPPVARTSVGEPRLGLTTAENNRNALPENDVEASQ